MGKDDRKQFLIELPSGSVKEIHGNRLVAVTDAEVALAFHKDPMDIVEDVDNVLRTVCNEYVDRSNGQTPDTAYLAICLTLLDMAVDGIAESKDPDVIKRSVEIVDNFLSKSKLKDMI